MRFRLTTVCLAMILGGFVCLRAAEGDPAERPAIRLPDDPQAVVLELAFDDGAGPQSAVSIRADGTIVAPGGGPDGSEPRGRISPDDLKAVVEEIVAGHRLLDCRTDRIADDLARESRRTGLEFEIPQAGTTILSVHLADRTHEVRCPAVELLAARFPRVLAVRRVCAAQRRMQNVLAIAQAGGIEETRRLAEIANAELKSIGLSGFQFTERDLHAIRGRKDGLRQAQFVHDPESEGREDAAGRGPRLVSIFEAPGAEVRVSVSPLDSRVR